MSFHTNIKMDRIVIRVQNSKMQLPNINYSQNIMFIYTPFVILSTHIQIVQLSVSIYCFFCYFKQNVNLISPQQHGSN